MKLRYTDEELDMFLNKVLESPKSYVEKVDALERYAKFARQTRYGKWELGGAEEMADMHEYFDTEEELLKRAKEFDTDDEHDERILFLWVTSPDGTEYRLCEKIWGKQINYPSV